MKQKQTTFNFQLPVEVLEELREESRLIGVSVSDIVKFRISQGRRKNIVEKRSNPANENYLFQGSEKRGILKDNY